MKKRGSAIIIAMLLITAIGGIAFGIGRLLFIEFNAASYYANGSVAYYAAESGLEEGFLRYRYDQNAEVPFTDWNLSNNFVYRSNLSDNSLMSANDTYNPTTNLVTDESKQFYDLRMGYLGTFGEPFYGHNASSNGIGYLNSDDSGAAAYGSGEYTFINLNKDESIKLNLNNVGLLSNQLILAFVYRGIAIDNLSKCQATAEVKFVVKDITGTHEYKGLTSFNPAECSKPANLNTSQDNLVEANTIDYFNTVPSTFYYSLDNIYANMLRQAGRSPAAWISNQEVTMFIRPLYHDAQIGLVTGSCNAAVSGANRTSCLANRRALVTGPYTTINTTGYYSKTTKKLQANIDRQSGTLYDLFDYVIYNPSP